MSSEVINLQRTFEIWLYQVSHSPVIAFDFLGFQFRARKTMWRKGEKRIFAHSFQPAASPKALKRFGRTVRSWTLHHRSDKSLTELAVMSNPRIRGESTYYT